MSRGRPQLSLLETILILSITGTVLAVFVPTFVERIRTDKIAEASELLQSLHDRVAQYYATRWDGGLERCLPPAAGPTPAETSVEPVDVDFFAEDTPGADTWRALGFQPERPLRYRYTYAPTVAGCGLGLDNASELVVFRADGDLDGDGVPSRFERRAHPRPDGALDPVEELFVDQRVE